VGETEDILFEATCRIADTIGRTLGPFCEVAVHDLRMPTHSLVHLVNGEVTGRELGAPIRDLIYRVLPEMNSEQLGLFNYLTELPDGRRLKSSTCLIRDSRGAALIALCINIDVTGIDDAARRLGELSAIDGRSVGHPSIKSAVQPEVAGDDVTAILRQLVLSIVRPMGQSPTGLSKHERLAIIEFLEKKGAFRIKGAIQLVANELGTSDATVYRDVDQIRRRIYSDGENQSLSDAVTELPKTTRRGRRSGL
jgi:predicted transcriptional regulator YheO